MEPRTLTPVDPFEVPDNEPRFLTLEQRAHVQTCNLPETKTTKPLSRQVRRRAERLAAKNRGTSHE